MNRSSNRRNGTTTSVAYADPSTLLRTGFDQSYDPVNGLNYENTASRYVVQAGDTLESIAQALWGDASFWYMIADANGLTGSDSLVAGQSIAIPNRVHNSHNSTDTWKVYDPNEAIGDTAPTAAKPPAKKQGCGTFGTILLVAIAVAVSAVTYGALTGEATTVLGGIAAGTASGAAGSVVSQGFGIATGLQSTFSWKGVALSALAGGVSGGVGASGLLKGATPFVTGAARGVAGSIVSQGLALATGLQTRFDWAGVAAAGLGGGVGSSLGLSGAGGRIVSGMAGGLAASAAQSLVSGSDFGDTLIANLPSIIGNTVGNLVADGIAGSGDPKRPARNQFAQADTGVRSDAPTPEEQYLAEIVVTRRRLGDQAAQKGRGFLNWFDGVFDTNLGGNNPHTRLRKSDNIVVTFYQPGVRSGAGYDRMGQPLNGRSSYDAGRQFSNIFSDASNVSLGTTLGRLGEWGGYTVPDAARLNAEIWDPYRGMTPDGRTAAMQMDRLTGGTISGIATGVSIQLGADPATQDLVYGLGTAGDGFLIAGGSMAGARVPGIGNQLELRLPQNVGINGNSKLSPRTAYLYELSLKDGTFLKNGVTQNLDTRYTKSFMADKVIDRVAEGSRADMLALERQITIANPGPLNNEPWAVKARRGN